MATVSILLELRTQTNNRTGLPLIFQTVFTFFPALKEEDLGSVSCDA